VGLRYHGLHHLLPGLPYHALGAAHRRIVAAMPPGAPYHRVNEVSLRAALRAAALLRAGGAT
jgi:fatty acid desaturase